MEINIESPFHRSKKAETSCVGYRWISKKDLIANRWTGEKGLRYMCVKSDEVKSEKYNTSLCAQTKQKKHRRFLLRLNVSSFLWILEETDKRFILWPAFSFLLFEILCNKKWEIANISWDVLGDLSLPLSMARLVVCIY